MNRGGIIMALGLICLGSAQAHEDGHEGPAQTAFLPAAMLEAPEPVACTLESGTETECLKLVVRYKPDDLEIGPFCPASLDHPGGIWNWTGEAAGLYRVDQTFLQMIAAQGYKMFNSDGDVFVSDISKAEPAEDHTCIQVGEDTSVEITALIPLEPEMAARPEMLGVVNKVGMSVSGVPIFSDAPSVQHTGHMPALDTCGGHVDPGGWYHWHANAGDIATVFHEQDVDADCALIQNPTALFGYAFDGFPIYGSLEPSGEIPADLDDCGGHVGDQVDGSYGYHYHTSNSFPNLPDCLSGVPALNNFATTAEAGIGAMRGQGGETTRRNPPRGGPDDARLEQAASELGVTTDALKQALRDAGGRPPNFSLVAETLGVGEDQLRAALPPPPHRR